MILRYSPPSPFARKVRIAAAVLGLEERIKLVPADTTNPADDLRQQAPLGKIPALILDDGAVLYDSRVILEYLDSEGGNLLIPPVGPARWRALTLAALCNGILDACILQVYEHRFRPPERRHPDALAYQADKVRRSLAFLEATPPPDDIQIGQIGLACALGYLDLRFDGAWRADHPRLVAWLDRFAAAVPAFGATRVAPT